MDFERVAKVDTHIHLAAAMTSKHLINFVNKKIQEHPDVSNSFFFHEESLMDIFYVYFVSFFTVYVCFLCFTVIFIFF